MPFRKGKTSMEGFWVNVHGERAGSAISGCESNEKDVHVTASCAKSHGLDDKTVRLVDWNVKMLVKLLQAIAASRAEVESGSRKRSNKPKRRGSSDGLESVSRKTPLEEVREIITLPEFGGKGSHANPEQMKIPKEVVQQLHHLVSSIAKLYNANSFHKNCCHATLLTKTNLLQHAIHSSSSSINRACRSKEILCQAEWWACAHHKDKTRGSSIFEPKMPWLLLFFPAGIF